MAVRRARVVGAGDSEDDEEHDVRYGGWRLWITVLVATIIFSILRPYCGVLIAFAICLAVGFGVKGLLVRVGGGAGRPTSP